MTHSYSAAPECGSIRRPPRPNRPAPGVPREVADNGPSPTGASPSSSKLRAGSRLGRYVVQKTIGRGGMGVVYGAVDPQLGRRVAIKLVRSRAHSRSDHFTARLRREALALARLMHPNIVTIFDIGVEPEGTFVAMEYVRGQNVRNWIQSRPRTWAEIVSVFVEAGSGLAAAHEAGIVHRDFKPANVMLTPRGHVKVLDFGLARGTPTADPWLSESDDGLLCRRLTQADTIVGTTGYMPPEQLLGREVDHRSDQFAFCVALFEALHGARPYEGANPIELARNYASENRVEIPSNPDLPPQTAAAIERGMSLDPYDRFEDMPALIEAIERSTHRRPRHILVAVGVLALLGTACAASGLTSWLAGPAASSAETCDVRTGTIAP